MAVDEEDLGDKVCSEVNAFLRKVDEDADCAEHFHLAKFVFNVPQEETGKAEGWIYGGGFGPKRGRTRSGTKLETLKVWSKLLSSEREI